MELMTLLSRLAYSRQEVARDVISGVAIDNVVSVDICIKKIYYKFVYKLCGGIG